MNDYPIRVEVDYPDHQSRLVTFFRYLLVLPHFLVLAFVLIVAYLAIIVSFFVVLITGRYPAGLYSFVSGTLRWVLRVNAYAYLLTSKYPPFSLGEDDSYPVRVHYDRPERIARWHVFNMILAIPMVIVFYAIQIIGYVVTVLAWFAAMVIGNNPKGLWNIGVVWVSWQARLSGYILFLTGKYPPLTFS